MHIVIVSKPFNLKDEDQIIFACQSNRKYHKMMHPTKRKKKEKSKEETTKSCKKIVQKFLDIKIDGTYPISIAVSSVWAGGGGAV